jgi:hypothetical protein
MSAIELEFQSTTRLLFRRSFGFPNGQMSPYRVLHGSMLDRVPVGDNRVGMPKFQVEDGSCLAVGGREHRRLVVTGSGTSIPIGTGVGRRRQSWCGLPAPLVAITTASVSAASIAALSRTRLTLLVLCF